MRNNILVIIFVLLTSVIVMRSAHIRDHIKIGGEVINVDLATTEFERERGLSGREALGANEGMLFVFPEEGLYSFWMKDMRFAIDIIWLDTNWQVVHIAANAEPDSFPQGFVSPTNAKYVLEVVAGFAESHNLRIGDQAQINFRIENPSL